MGMNIIKVGNANAKFEKHAQRIKEECEELSTSISDAIEAVDVDTKNRWVLNGFTTCRVVYVDASAYLPEVVAAVAAAFQDEGYVVNTMVMDGETDDPDVDATMTMLAVLWDPKAAFGLCTNCRAEEEEGIPAEAAQAEEEVQAAEGDTGAATGSEVHEEEEGAAPTPEEGPEGFPE